MERTERKIMRRVVTDALSANIAREAELLASSPRLRTWAVKDGLGIHIEDFNMTVEDMLENALDSKIIGASGVSRPSSDPVMLHDETKDTDSSSFEFYLDDENFYVSTDVECTMNGNGDIDIEARSVMIACGPSCPETDDRLIGEFELPVVHEHFKPSWDLLLPVVNSDGTTADTPISDIASALFSAVMVEAVKRIWGIVPTAA